MNIDYKLKDTIYCWIFRR